MPISIDPVVPGDGQEQVSALGLDYSTAVGVPSALVRASSGEGGGVYLGDPVLHVPGDVGRLAVPLGHVAVGVVGVVVGGYVGALDGVGLCAGAFEIGRSPPSAQRSRRRLVTLSVHSEHN